MISKNSQIFFYRANVLSFPKPIDQGFALDNIDDILLLAHTKNYMVDLIEQLNQIRSSNDLNLAMKKPFISSLLSKFLEMNLATKLLNQFHLKLMVSTN